MDQADLVMSIVFDDNIKAFSDNLTHNECSLLVRTFPILCKNNAKIRAACNKHSAKYWYEAMHDNIVSLSMAKIAGKNTGDLQNEESRILFSVWTSDKDVQNMFRDLVIAEYKEYTYLEMWKELQKVEVLILNEYERLVFEWWTADEIMAHDTDNVQNIYEDTLYYSH
jgi:hypothetical protein